MAATCVLNVFLGLVLFAFRTHSIMWEADMPSLLKQCYEEHTRGLTVSDIPSHDVQSYCLGSYIWQIPHIQRQVNMTESQINYIKSVYREYQHKMYSARRQKRQAQRAIRRELRVLSDAERQKFFDALNALKADGVNNSVLIFFELTSTDIFFLTF